MLDTIQDVIGTRLRRLAPELLEVLGAASIVGRMVPVPLLRGVAGLPERQLVDALTALRRAGFLLDTGLSGGVEYTFAHALTHEVVYGGVPPSRRRELHDQLVEVIERLHADRLLEHVDRLAHHAVMAEAGEKALSYLQQAGRYAIERSANAEAIDYLTKALDVLVSQPAVPERARRELTLRIPLGSALIAARGNASPEAEQVYRHARELAERVGTPAELFAVLVGLQGIYTERGRLRSARELAEPLLDLARREQDPALLLRAHYAMGHVLFYLGELTEARSHFEEATTLTGLAKHHAYFSWRVFCLSYSGWVSWLLGQPDRATARVTEALALAEELARPHAIVWALFYAGRLHQFRREGELALQRAEEMVRRSRQWGFLQAVAEGVMLQGGALVEQGRGEEAIARIREGLAAWQSTEVGIGRPWYLVRLAEAFAALARPQEVLDVLGDAAALVASTDERWWDAELLRLRGELRGRCAEPADALPEGVASDMAAHFHQALDVARRQRAKSLELRAAMSLCRLWQRQRQPGRARELLAGVYACFREGMETPDLREARALLDELSAGLDPATATIRDRPVDETAEAPG